MSKIYRDERGIYLHSLREISMMDKQDVKSIDHDIIDKAVREAIERLDPEGEYDYSLHICGKSHNMLHIKFYPKPTKITIDFIPSP